MRLALLMLLALPATAQAPSLEQLVGAYVAMPWRTDAAETLACVSTQESKIIDYIVGQLAAKAKAKITCS